tara:strand:- start:583 stop:966 length:384 start_codon:yes stop_codon:yes gene_type:complete
MTQPGLSWGEWIADPGNKKLFEWNQVEARKKFLRDENDYIEQIILHERILQEKADMTSIANMALTSGVGGVAASGGGGYGDEETLNSPTFNTGIGNYAIGTFFNSEGEQVATLALAGANGFDRFTIS